MDYQQYAFKHQLVCIDSTYNDERADDQASDQESVFTLPRNFYEIGVQECQNSNGIEHQIWNFGNGDKMGKKGLT